MKGGCFLASVERERGGGDGGTSSMVYSLFDLLSILLFSPLSQLFGVIGYAVEGERDTF